MPPPVFRYDFLIEALAKVGVKHLERLPNGDVRWGDMPLEKPYKGKSFLTRPLNGRPEGPADRVLFDLWSIRGILNKFSVPEPVFYKVYFGKTDDPPADDSKKS